MPTNFTTLPHFSVSSDELSEVGGRADKRRASKVGEPRLHLEIDEARVDLLVELVDDLRRRVLGYADAIPVARLIAGHESRTVGMSGNASERVAVTASRPGARPCLRADDRNLH